MSINPQGPQPDTGEDMPIVRIRLPSAEAYADTISVIADLQFVVSCCERLHAELNRDQADGLVIQALWSAAVVAYARCFGTGKRQAVSVADVEGLGALELHEWVMNMRNKHVAHAVNPFEKVDIGAVLSKPDSTTGQVEGIAEILIKWVSAMPDDVAELARLAHALLERINPTYEEQGKAVLAEANALDIEELYSKPRIAVEAPGPTEAGTATPRMGTDFAPLPDGDKGAAT
ncbi:hypothetical protein [Phytoactinopolyspora mesophila]|uniref:Uncharacterized protein n=1 Tax=Phytoactinopolyspora mesophila TaxID=2650750 RepID=A0A7K3MCT1_9ACTN|nr:hypothetical protein [Phytoactinopolyspora mesophila]NDL61000.1 hypothetical protein [Phytoactinopolyspora mesophila]